MQPKISRRVGQSKLQKGSTVKYDTIKESTHGIVKLNFFGEQDGQLYTGSKVGICLSFTAITTCLIYLSSAINQMQNREFDNLISVTTHNDFKEVDIVQVLKYSNILPIFHLSITDSNGRFDVFESNQTHISDDSNKRIDYNKLSQYIQV